MRMPASGTDPVRAEFVMMVMVVMTVIMMMMMMMMVMAVRVPVSFGSGQRETIAGKTIRGAHKQWPCGLLPE